MLHLEQAPVSPEPLAVACALADRPGLALLWDVAGGSAFVACDPVAASAELDPEPDLPRRTGVARVPRWIGVLPYECRRSIERTGGSATDLREPPHVSEPLWLRYGAVLRIADRVEVIGDDLAAVRRLKTLVQRGPQREPAPVRMRTLEPAEPDEVHQARIRHALELIADGRIYQVNLARRWRAALAGHSLDVLGRLVSLAPSAYAALLELPELSFVSTSPELFLDLDAAGTVCTTPIKGTRPRGSDAAADARLKSELEADPKEHAELTMVLDIERNDLGRVCRTGSVALSQGPAVFTFGPVHHRLATVSGELRPDVGRHELLEAMLPSGSVTGAPKVAAMEVIARLEAHRRGLYTGAYGSVGHDGSLKLAMAIRCLTVKDGAMHYFAGGGIVADSDPARETEETRWKARQLAALNEVDSSLPAA